MSCVDLRLVDNPYASDLTSGCEPVDLGQGDDTSVDDADEDLDAEFSAASTNEDMPPGKGSGVRLVVPAWLANEYKTLQERLEDEMRRSTNGLPLCYERGSFYDGTLSTFLSAHRVHQVEPGLFHRPTFFVWLPHLLVPRLTCPACTTTKQKGRDGLVPKLHKCGWVRYARRIIDVDRSLYLASYAYRCSHKDCRRHYLGWSPDLLGSLPRSLALEFPFQLTRRCGLTNWLASLLYDALGLGMGAGPFTQMIQSLHYRRYDETRLQFLEFVHERMTGDRAHLLTKIMPFGNFGDRDGYAGHVPSAKYFACFYDNIMQRAAPEMKQLIAMSSVRVLQADHSFKVS